MDRPLSAHRDSSGIDHNNSHHRSYNNNPRRGGRGGGGRRGGYHHHGGGGRGRGFRDRGGRGGGGRYPPQYHEPYGGGRGRGRGGGRGPPPSSSQSNRFCAEPPSHDPQFLLLQQLNEMLYQVGQVPHQLLEACATEHQTTMEDDQKTMTRNESSQQQPQQDRRHQRLLWTADNVARLTQVVCQRAHLFLQSSSDPNPKDAAVVAGPLASSLVQAVATGPLQTNPYTALTVAVVTTLQQSPPSSPSSSTPNAGRALAERTVNYVLCRLAHDLNAMFLYNDNHNDTTSLARRVVRVRLWLQYLVLLSRVGLVALTRSSSATTGEPDDNEPNDEDEEDWMDPVVAATNQSALTLVELLQVLVQAATCVGQSTPPSLGSSTTTTIDSNLAHILAHVVQSTLPYLLLTGGAPQTVSAVRIQHDLVQPLHNLSSSFLNHAPHSSSVFEPGIGSQAILLPYEQDDAKPTGTVKAEDTEAEEEEEEEDEMDDDEDDAARPLCDSLQELQTCLHTLSTMTPYPSRVSLFTDDPWNVMPSSNNNNNNNNNKDATMDEAPSQDGESIPKEEPNDSTMNTNNNKPSTTEAVVYTEPPLMLHFFSHCRALTLLLGGPAALSSSSEAPPTWRTWSLASRHPLQGVVVGRLPIFGSPPTDDGEEEEDDEEEEEEHDNERLRLYRKTFGQVDRYFLGQAVRDCLLCHEPKVSPVGVERGTLKAVAEQVWSLRHFVLDSDTEPTKQNPMKQEEGEPADATATADKETTSAPTAAIGLEFVVVEVILSLIVQSGTIWTESILDVTYLSRILLELIKVEPAAMTAATVLGVATLVEDYMPTLTPTARYNLCQWFSFHLIHSNYQWPADYWTHWQSFVFVGGGSSSVWANSRGAFVRESLALVLEHASPDTISDMVSHLPHALIETMIPPDSEQAEPEGASRKFLDTLKQDLGRRIWGMEEDPFSILQYMGTDELKESFQSALQEEASMTETPSANATFWRTKALIRALWIPLYGERGDLRILLLEKSQPNADAMDQDLSMMENETTDALAQVLNAIRKYRALIEGVVAQETQQQQEGGESNDEKKKELALECECIFLDLLSECCLSYSRTAWITVTKRLLEESILSPMGLLRWSTTGSSSSTETETRDTFSFQHLMEVQLRGWCWEVCEAAMQISGSRLFPVVSDYGHIGLAAAARDTNDDNATNTAPDQGKSRDVRNAESFVTFATPLIQLFLERVRAILLSVPSSDNDDDDNKPRKKLAPQHVAVLEGCKRVVHATRDAYVSCLETARTTRDASFYSDILAVYQESSLAGPNLATLVAPQQGEEESTLSLQVLRQCLERMV